jgi:hypothetical protein
MAKATETLPTITLKLWEETKQKQPKTHERNRAATSNPTPKALWIFSLILALSKIIFQK